MDIRKLVVFAAVVYGSLWGYAHYKGTTVKHLMSSATNIFDTTLSSKYVVKIPNAAPSSSTTVVVYSASSSFNSDVPRTEGKLAGKGYKFIHVDINADPSQAVAFQNLMTSMQIKDYALPAFIVNGYVIFNNSDAADEIDDVIRTTQKN